MVEEDRSLGERLHAELPVLRVTIANAHHAPRLLGLVDVGTVDRVDAEDHDVAGLDNRAADQVFVNLRFDAHFATEALA